MIISTTKRFNYRFKIQPKLNHRINQILNLYKKNDGKQKVLRGALIKRRDFLWIWKMLFQCRKKESCLPNKTFSLKRKNNVWGSFQEPIEILFTFCRIFGDSNAAKRGDNRGGGGVASENPLGSSMDESRMETAEYIWANIEKLQECGPSAQIRSTVKKCKKWGGVSSNGTTVRHILNNIKL